MYIFSAKVRALVAGLLVTAGTVTAASAAQAAPSDGANDPTVIRSDTADIIVTANKREENILDIPSSVTAVGNKLIERIRANSLSDISAYVPGLFVSPDGADGNRIVIRGLSTGPNDLSPSVAVYIDDAPFGASSGLALGALFSPDLDPSDLQRVEVLRGPQGTLYGANTLGGLVRYVTKTPELHEFSVHISADYGVTDNNGDSNPDNYILRAGANIPLIDGVAALRVSGFYRHAQGATTNAITGENNLNSNTGEGARASLLLKPADRVTISLEGAYQRSDSPNLGVVLGDGQTLAPVYGRTSGADYVAQYQRSRYFMGQGSLRYALDSGITFSNTASYSDYKINQVSDYTTIYRPALGPSLAPTLGLINSLSTTQVVLTTPGILAPRVKRLTDEFRIASPSTGRFQWLAGFFYDRQNTDYVSDFSQQFNDPTGPYAALLLPVVNLLRSAVGNYITSDTQNHYREYAGFANATFSVTPTVELGAGVRYSRINQTALLLNSGVVATLIQQPPVSVVTSSDSVWTESFDARWHFAPKTMVYARVSRGYRPGGPNPTSGSFQPDTTWNYEAGVKTSALDGKLSADVSAFFIDWKNIQLNHLDPATTTIILENAGTAYSRGVEAEATYTPDSHWVVGGNAAFTDATMHSVKPGTTTGASPGDTLPFDSKWAVTGRADYYVPLSGGLTANLGTSVRYRSAFNTTFPGDASTRFYRLPETTFVDLRAGLAFKDNYTLTLQVLNIGNVRRLQTAQESVGVSFAQADAARQPAFVSYTQGRAFTISAGLKF